MVLSDPLDVQLREIAWVEVSRRWPSPGGIPPADPRDFEAGDDERRAGCLGLLRVYTRMIKILQRRIDATVNAALATGASYGQVAAACGVSRQAARQRWLRHRQRQDELLAVQLASGPPDPGYGHAQAGRTAMSASPAGGTPTTATPSPDRPQAGSAGAKVRVYELAKEFGVESRVVMTRLQRMGEFIRSAASTVETSAVRKLREEFSVRKPPG